MNAAVAAAVAEFPELRRLVDLREAGWFFLSTEEDGVVVEVHGVRAWPGGWADAIRVRSPTDVCALRCDYDGGRVWELDGGLVEVVDRLIALPSPEDACAPRLVRGSAPRLWTP